MSAIWEIDKQADLREWGEGKVDPKGTHPPGSTRSKVDQLKQLDRGVGGVAGSGK